MKVFVDTGMWFAYLVRTDQYHNEAAKVMSALQAEGALLVTSELVISETYTLLMRKLGTKAALSFLDIIKTQIEKRFTEIVWVDWGILEHAREILGKFSDQSITLADATSAAIVNGRGISQIATFDHHFKLLGITCIP